MENVTGLKREQRERFSRQIMLPQIGEEGQKKLLSGSVLVVGAGGLGSPAIMYLAAAGVGHITAADGDRTELSNLNRQTVHRTDSLGIGKAHSAEEFILGLNPGTDVRVIDRYLDSNSLRDILPGHDFVLDCTDGIGSKLMINDVCVHSGKPFCHGGVEGFKGQVMTWLPGFPDLRQVTGWGDMSPESDHLSRDMPRGIMGGVCGVAGSVMAMEAVKFITGAGSLLTGKIFSFDLFDMRTRIVNNQ